MSPSELVVIFSFFAAVAGLAGSATTGEAAVLSPILIFPGFIGSQLYVEVTSDPFNCSCCTSGQRLWVNQTLNDKQPECLVNDLILLYNETDNTYANNSGAKVTVPGFGNTSTVEYLEPTTVPYFNTFVSHFVDKFGYKRGKTIRAVPYDWRLAAGELNRTGYYSAVKDLIETMYTDSGGAKVTIVVHSMGGYVSLFFLTKVVTQDWKERYVNGWVTLSGAWTGGSGALETIISSPLHMADRTFQGLLWLMPNYAIVNDTVLVRAGNNRTYTAKDYQALFKDIGYPEGYQKYEGTLPLNKGFPAPNVSTHCFYGTDVDTKESFVYGNGFDKPPTVTAYGDGDGTVNLVELEVCLKWGKGEQSAPFESKTFKKVKHGEMVTDSTVLKAVEKIVVS